MTPDRLRRVAEVLETALELEGSLRDRYLAALARSDLDLVRQVHELLDAESGKTEKATPSTRAAESGEETTTPGAVRQIGPYRVVDWLGTGGMGTVHLAERSDEEFERRVAIKIIRFGFDSPEVRRRFLSERQILATFDHPNIAKLYEGGTTPEGHPYLVMEYIDGLPIDRYCDEKRLTVQERLGLFRQVCSAVDYAHRNLVVHRDLKPSNVLVTADGVPKLLDFGIAKLLDPEHFPVTVEATETGHGPLTPNYASPEQIAAERVTTQSDVYSLGVLLYKLLTGRLPFDRQARSRALLAKEAALQEPTRPSLLVSGAGAAKGGHESTGDSSLWSVGPGQHRRQLQGDIDNIVLKALRSEPERRYGSVQLFEEDVGRHLAGLPVRARQAGTAYRLSKFIRRHRLPMAAAAAFSALIVGFLLFTLQQNTEIRQARDQAVEQEKRAEKVAEFFIDLFAQLRPENARGRDLTSREILNTAAQNLFDDETADPTVRAQLLRILGQTYMDFGDREAALPLIEAAYEESLPLGGKVLGMALIVRARYASNDPDGNSLDDAKRAAEVFAGIGALADLSKTYSTMALWTSDHAEAEKLARLAIRVGEQANDTRAQGMGWNNLALVLGESDLASATAALERGLELDRADLPEDHPDLVLTVANLALFYQFQGRLEESGRLGLEALEKATKIFGERAPVVGVDHNNRALHFYTLGQYESAEDHARQALSIWEESYGPDYPSNWYPLNNLCVSLAAQARTPEALTYCDRAVAILDAQGWTGLSARLNRCRALRSSGERRAALGCIDEAMEIYLEDPNRDRFAARFVAGARVELGLLHAAEGDRERAFANWEEVLEVSPESRGAKNLQIIVSHLRAKLYLGRHDEIDEELAFLQQSGLRSQEIELYCLEAEPPPVCEGLEALFPPTPWPAEHPAPAPAQRLGRAG